MRRPPFEGPYNRAVRFFLTGATGYIGGAIARRLLADGHEVATIARDLARAQALSEAGVRCFPGDVRDRISMREAMSGADWVVHAAAELDFRVPEESMRRVNVDGAENVASLAWKLGVGRLLAVSSIAVFGGSPEDGSAADERSPVVLPLPSPYSRTKAAADAAVEAWAARGLRVNLVFPSLVYGPPAKKSGTNALLRAFALNRMPAVVGGDRIARWIHLDDLVEGIARLIDRAPAGEGYLMTGEAAPVGEVVRRVCDIAGARPPRLRLSPAVAYGALTLLGPALRAAGVRGLPTRPQVRSLARHWNFDDSKARRGLDWTPRGLDQGLPSAVEHLLGL